MTHYPAVSGNKDVINGNDAVSNRNESGRDLVRNGDVNDESIQSRSLIERRNFMKVLGVGAVGVSGLGLANSTSAAITGGGPPNTSDWAVVFEDDFDSGSLDTSNWSVGWGWGQETNNGPTGIREECITFEGSNIVLDLHESGGSPYAAGGINTKNKVTIGPGSYVEARAQMANLPGSNSAFWSKPNSEAWPPEIDYFESLHSNSGPVDADYHIHYSTDGQPNGPHASIGLGDADGWDHSQRFAVYGCRWLEDSLTYYLNGEAVAQTTRDDVMTSVNNGAPFYIMLNTIIAGWMDGPPDDWSPYKTSMEVDWVRVWEPSAGGSGGTTTSDGSNQETETTDDGGSNDEDHYIWIRSANGDPVTFAFRAGGGNIRLDSSGHEADFWIADDGETAGGTTDLRIGIPGFWYQGDITDFSYDGPIQVYIHNEPVDPDTLVDESRPGPGDIDDTPEYPTLSNTFAVDGNASYSVSVSDRIVPTASTADESIDSGTTASGSVSGGVDEYTFDGSMTELSLDGDAAVYRNGSRVNLLEIERAGDSGTVTYLVESTGRLLKADVLSASINSNDERNGGKAHGRVVGGRDAYWVIGGEIVDVSTFGGEVVTELDGDVVDLAR